MLACLQLSAYYTEYWLQVNWAGLVESIIYEPSYKVPLKTSQQLGLCMSLTRARNCVIYYMVSNDPLQQMSCFCSTVLHVFFMTTAWPPAAGACAIHDIISVSLMVVFASVLYM